MKIQKRRSKIRFLLRTPIQKIYSLNKFQIPLCFSKILQLDTISNLNTLPSYTLDLKKNGSNQLENYTMKSHPVWSEPNNDNTRQSGLQKPLNSESSLESSLSSIQPVQNKFSGLSTGNTVYSDYSDIVSEHNLLEDSTGKGEKTAPSLGRGRRQGHTQMDTLEPWNPNQLNGFSDSNNELFESENNVSSENAPLEFDSLALDLQATGMSFLRKDLWYMKSQFFRHIGWNMKHEIIGTSFFQQRGRQNQFHPRADRVLIRQALLRRGRTCRATPSPLRTCPKEPITVPFSRQMVISNASSQINQALSLNSHKSYRMEFNPGFNIYGGSWYFENLSISNKKLKGTTEINGPGQFSFSGGAPVWYGVARNQSGSIPDIGIYSLAHKLASLGLRGGNSDINIYPFKYNDYYRYNFQNMNLRSFSNVAHNEKENGRKKEPVQQLGIDRNSTSLITDFLYSRRGQERKFLDFENPIYSRIYAPLFQPQGVAGKNFNLLSFISDRITPSVNPNLKDSADSSVVPHVFLSLMNRGREPGSFPVFPSTQTRSFWKKRWGKKTLPVYNLFSGKKKPIVGLNQNKPISEDQRSESKIFHGLHEKLPIKGLHTNPYPWITQNAHERWLDSAQANMMSQSTWTSDSSQTPVGTDLHLAYQVHESGPSNTRGIIQQGDKSMIPILGAENGNTTAVYETPLSLREWDPKNQKSYKFSPDHRSNLDTNLEYIPPTPPKKKQPDYRVTRWSDAEGCQSKGFYNLPLNTNIGTQVSSRFRPESRFTYKPLIIKKPSIFFSSFRHLPYFLIAQNTHTNLYRPPPFKWGGAQKTDSSVFSDQVNRHIIDDPGSAFSNENFSQSRLDNSSTSSETRNWSGSSLQEKKTDGSLSREDLPLSKNAYEKSGKHRDEIGRRHSGSTFLYKKPFNLIHKFFTIKPLSAFTKKEMGYMVSLPPSGLLNKSLLVSPIKTNLEAMVEKKGVIGRSTDDLSRPMESARSIPLINPIHNFQSRSIWKIFPPLFQHLTFRFVDLNLPRTGSSDIITKNPKVDGIGLSNSSLIGIGNQVPVVNDHINRGRQDKKTGLIGSDFGDKKKHSSFDLSKTMKWTKEIKQKKKNLSPAFSSYNLVPVSIEKNFFRFPLPFYFSDFFQSPLSPRLERQTNNNLINSGLYTMGGDHGLVFAQPIIDFRRGSTNNLTGPVSRVESTEFSNRNPSDQNQFYSSQLLTNPLAKGYPTKSKRSTNNDVMVESNKIPGSAIINLEYEGIGIDPIQPDSSSFRETQIAKDQELETDWLEPKESYANQDETYWDESDYATHNPTGFKIQVYGEKPLLKNRTPHGPGGSGRNQKESISLPNYLKNITNQNYQNLYRYPREAASNVDEGGSLGIHPQTTVMVFWILFNKTLFIYLSLHYLQKFITFLGTEYIRNLFKIFVTMKFIDGNILSIIKTFQDFNFQLNQQNIIDIKVNKQLKSIKRN